MAPATFFKTAACLVAVSITTEATLLAGVFELGTTPYHLFHLLLMVVLVGSQAAVWLRARKLGAVAGLALLFAIGAFSTGIGDFVNGAASGIEPVSLKLTWALLLFGIGYTLYSVALWKHNDPILKQSSSRFASARYLIAVPILAFNVYSWFDHVHSAVDGHELLMYGSFIFNATIYVALPLFALWFFYNSGWSLGGLVVLIGAILIPYSDLILFESWLKDGDPAVPSFALYAINWIVYFSGQVLIACFPALAIESQQSAEA